MNLKKQQSIILVLILICTGVFIGCTGSDRDNDANGHVSYPVFSSIDGNILDTAYVTYAGLRQMMSPMDARIQLLHILNNETDGVEVAELGIDGYTIFVTFSDDDFAMVDTFELDEELQNTTEFSVPLYNNYNNGNSQMEYRAVFDLVSSESLEYLPRGRINKADYNIIVVGPEEKTTCESKKVLVLGPCYWEFDPESIDQCIDLFKAHGWNDDDITLKLVELEPEDEHTDCMTLTPEDYFDMSDYGIILFTGHGTVKIWHDINESSLFLQFCYLDNASFLKNERFSRWKAEKKLMIGQRHKSGTGASARFIYSTAIRADVLREELGELPSSFCCFATCFGGFFNKVFLDKGAKVFLGWNNKVLGYYADENMRNIVKQMLEKECCVYDAYADNSIVKSYDWRDSDNPTRAIIIQPGKNPYFVKFDIYPDPSIDKIAFSFYMPTWVNLRVTGIPNDAYALRIKVYDEDSKVVIQGEKTIEFGQTEVELQYIADVCFPPTENYTIEVAALNSGGQELTAQETNVRIHPGTNTVRIKLTESAGLAIEFFNQENGQLDVRKCLYQGWFLMIHAKLQKIPNGEIIYIWDALGDSSLGGFGRDMKQHYEGNQYSVGFYSSGNGTDGTKIPITCTAYLVKEDGTRELVDLGSAEIEVYYPTQIYELCGSDPTQAPYLGSGSNWNFYIVDHGPISNQFYARTGDQIRTYCKYAGYMATETLNYDIYIRVGTTDDLPEETQLIVSESEIKDGLDKIVTITI